jgi:Zn-dependent protease with chaperone function
MDTLLADYFDGRSSKPNRVRLSVGAGVLQVQGVDADAPPLSLSLPTREVRWPERTRHGSRIAQLPGGASLHSLDSALWDAFVQAHVRSPGWVERSQQSWRVMMVSLVALSLLAVVFYVWGLPQLTRSVVPLIPRAVDAQIGQTVLEQLDARLLKPSQLPEEQKQRITARLELELRKSAATRDIRHRLVFRASRIGPNAFALPDGTIVVTDELVHLASTEDMVLGVLGHEWGHVLHRHAMRQVIQTGAVQMAISAAMGDYASVMVTAPVILASMGYSRDFEREADEESVRFMRGAGISPAVMADFFGLMRNWQEDKRAKSGKSMGIGILSSHPDDAERIEFFRRAW